MIKYNSQINKFELILSEDIIETLHLNTLKPAHDDKLKLEWLELEIEKEYHVQKKHIEKIISQNKKNEKICIAGMVSMIIIGSLFSNNFSAFLKMPVWAVKLAVTAGFLYFVCGLISNHNGFPLVNMPIPLIGTGKDVNQEISELLKIVQLRQVIAKDFSIAWQDTLPEE